MASISALVGKDVDATNQLGLAISANPLWNVNSLKSVGEWMYRYPTSFDWQTLPPVSEYWAFLLSSDMWLRFVPAAGYYGQASLTAFIWDQTQFFAGDFTDVVSNSPTSPFSINPVTVVAGRQGCDGNFASSFVLNACCSCVSIYNSTPSSCALGCDGRGGVADICGVCGGDGRSCSGCNVVPYSGLLPDSCGLCFGRNTSRDCHGDCFGSAFIDDCGHCVGGNTGLSANYAKDCAQMCGGTAIFDDCGQCVGGNTGLVFNFAKDCRGTCFGNFSRDTCGFCQAPWFPVHTKDCMGVCFGSANFDECGQCVAGGTSSPLFNSWKDVCGVCNGTGTSCIGCDGIPNSGHIVDQCGVCGGNSTCLHLTFSRPNVTSTNGGAVLQLFGAGFINGPLSHCKFQVVIGTSTTIYFSPLTAIDRAHASCLSPSATLSALFGLSVTMDGITFSSEVPFLIYNTSNIPPIISSSIQSGLTTANTTVVFTGASAFPQTNDPMCYLPELNLLSVKGFFISASTIACILPPVQQSVMINPRISLNGVLAESLASPSSFTYFAPSAQLLSASFVAMATQLLISWDVPVNTSILNTCQQIWDDITMQALGSLSNCTFVTTTELIIQLHQDATIFPGSILTVRSSAVYVYGQTYSYPSHGSVTVQSLDSSLLQALQPMAVINSPDVIPLCGNLTISGSQSTGGAYAGLRYTFAISSNAPSMVIAYSILDLISNHDPLSPTLSIPWNLFNAGTEYQFTLTVRNIFGQDSVIPSYSSPLALSSLINVPSTTILGGPFQEVHGWEPIHLRAVLVAFPCQSMSAMPAQLTATPPTTLMPIYSWQIDQCLDVYCLNLSYVGNNIIHSESTANGVESIGGGGSGISGGSNSLSVFFDPSILQPNSLYIVRLFANTSSYSNPLLQLANTKLARRINPIQCLINGGNRQVPFNSPLTLNLISSLDTEFFNSSIAVMWACQTNAGGSCVDVNTTTHVFSLSFALNQTQLNVPAQSLTPGVYIFSALLRRDGQTSECSVNVTIVPPLSTKNYSMPSVFIEPMASLVSADSNIYLYAWVSSSSSFSYSWSCLSIGECRKGVLLLGYTKKQMKVGRVKSKCTEKSAWN